MPAKGADDQGEELVTTAGGGFLVVFCAGLVHGGVIVLGDSRLTIGIIDKCAVDIESDLAFLGMPFQGLPGWCCWCVITATK